MICCGSIVSFGQEDFEELDEPSQTKTKVKKEVPDKWLTNKGVFLNTVVGFGMTHRRSNGTVIDPQKITTGANLSVQGEFGITPNFRAGLVFERTGNTINTDDSLRIYSLNGGINLHYRFLNEDNNFYYTRFGFGSSSLQMLDIFIVSNRDSFLLVSKGGMFFNFEIGHETRLNNEVNFFYGAKFSYLLYPEIHRINIYKNSNNGAILIGQADDPKKLSISYRQVFLVFGLSFKL